MRTLVVGGAGALGSHVVDRLLVQGHEVDVVDDLSSGRLTNLAESRSDRSLPLRVHTMDATGPELATLAARRSPEVIVHVARAGAGASVRVAAEAGVLGMVSVLDAARTCGAAKVVAVVRDDLYSPAARTELPIKEGHPVVARTARGMAARAALGYLGSHREAFGIEHTALVVGTLASPRRRAGLLASIVTALIGRTTVTVHGDGEQLVDVVGADDVADAVARAVDGRGDGLTVNVGSGTGTPVLEVIARLARLVDVEPMCVYAAPPDGRSSSVVLDVTRARIQLGWAPFTGLDEALALAASR